MYNLRVEHPVSDLRSSIYTLLNDDINDNSSNDDEKNSTVSNNTPAHLNATKSHKRPASPWSDEAQPPATRQRRSPSLCPLEGTDSWTFLRSTHDAPDAEAPSYERPSPTPSSSTASCSASSSATAVWTPYYDGWSSKVLSSPPSRLLPAVWQDEDYYSDTTAQPEPEYSSSEAPPSVPEPTPQVSSVVQMEPIKTIRVAAQCTLSDKDLCELGPGISQAITQVREKYEEEKKKHQALAQLVEVRCPHRVQPTPQNPTGRCDDLVIVKDLIEHLKENHKDSLEKAVNGTSFPCPFHRLEDKKPCQDINKRKGNGNGYESESEGDSEAETMTARKIKRTKNTKEGDGNLGRHLRSIHLDLGSRVITVELAIDEATYPVSVTLPLGGRTDLTNRAYGHAVLRVIQDLQRQRKVALPGPDVYAKWASKGKSKAVSSPPVPQKVTASGSKTKVAASSNKGKKTPALRSKAKVAAGKPQRAKARSSST